MDDKKTLLTLIAVMAGTLAMIVGFAFVGTRPVKPITIDIGNSYFRGAKEAKVVVVEYSDFECPSCAAFTNDIMPQLLPAYQDRVKFVNKFFPLYEIHSMANITAQSAFCAGKVSSATDAAEMNAKFWEYSDNLMKKSDDWKDKPEKLVEYATALKINKDDFVACQNSNEAKDLVLNDRRQGELLGVNSTPTFFINGEKVVGLQSVEVWKKMLDEKLKK
jgi:protein-disulfide isomerase